MSKLKIAASVVLLGALLMPSIVSCSAKSGEASQTTAAADVSSASTETTEPETELYKSDSLPEKDYDGYVFRMITVPDWENTSVVENENGDVINDAFYKRNLVIEEKYDIKFTQTELGYYDDLTQMFKKSAAASSDDFDLCRLIMRDAFSLATSGYVAQVSELPYLDVSQPWYIKDVNEALTISGQLLFAYSDECVPAFVGAMCVFFNQSIVENLGLDSPYDMVDAGTWTIDRFFETAGAAISDINGDGQYDIDNDRFGVIDEYDMFIPSFWIGAGMKTVDKDSDGIPYMCVTDDDRFFTLLGKVYDNWSSDGMCFDSFLQIKQVEESRLIAINAYTQGSALYHIGGFNHTSMLRDMESDFGIVPLPKYDESQEVYYSRLCDAWINLPLYCASDLERTSIIMEALAIESKNYVIPAIYEDAILNKYIRDDKSVEMLEMLMEHRIIDLGDTIWMDPIRNIFANCFVTHKPDFASAAEKKANVVNNTIEKAVTAIEEVSAR